MKILFATEDSIFGILLAAIVVGLSGKYFKLPTGLEYVWGALFAIGIILVLFDIIHTFTDLSRHPMVLIGSLINNILEGTIFVAFVSKFFNFTIPMLTTYAQPYISNPTYLFYIGAFLAVSNVIWLVIWPMFD
jgi:hypothetical protein